MKPYHKRETKEEAGVDIQVNKISEIVYGSSGSYAPLHFIVLAEETTGSLKTNADHDSLGTLYFYFRLHLASARFPLSRVLVEMTDPRLKDKKYRKPWEILPFLQHYAQLRKNGNFIPIY